MEKPKIEKWNFNKRHGSKRTAQFAQIFLDFQEQIGFKVSSRGWCYLMEQNGIIDKSQFDKVEQIINRCRKTGLLPVDFVAEEEARQFYCVYTPNRNSYEEHILDYIRGVDNCEYYYEPDWWEGEKYYIQMVVEKIDLRTLFMPVCEKYHIPIANSRGWSSISQRAKYTRRFKRAEMLGMRCVLLYCGDYDPDGERISDFLRTNLEQVKDITWSDGVDGYDPSNLIIERFGLNRDFIEENNLSWIENLITSGGELAKVVNGKIVAGKTSNGRPHPNFPLPYLQDYLALNGVRKCEANAVVVIPDKARDLCEQTVLNYLGEDAPERFRKKKEKIKEEIAEVKRRVGWDVFSRIMTKRLSK
jgi:hypothetical protein